jgi:hypothetical protein
MPDPRHARLTLRDIAVAVEAALLSGLVDVGIRCARLPTIVCVLGGLPRTRRPAPMARTARIALIADGVTRRLWMDATCLKRSLVTYALLRRRRVDASLVIAHRVRPFEAHAWIEHAGQVVCAADERTSFKELWRAPARAERAERVEG